MSTISTMRFPSNDETEPYTVGNELGPTGRFVRNLCDPVIKATTPLPNMAGLTFADIQALAYTEDVIPDVCLGILSSRANIHNVLMVGGIKTPWTTRLQNIRLSNLGHAPLLEPIMGLTLYYLLL
jgi:hypothetical protein